MNILDAGIPSDADALGDVRKELEQVLLEARKDTLPEKELVKRLTSCLIDNGLTVVGEVTLALDGVSDCSATVKLPEGGTQLIKAICPR